MFQGEIMWHYYPLFFTVKNIILPREYNVNIISLGSIMWKKPYPFFIIFIFPALQLVFIVAVPCQSTLKHKVIYVTREFFGTFSPGALGTLTIPRPAASGSLTSLGLRERMSPKLLSCVNNNLLLQLWQKKPKETTRRAGIHFHDF